MRATFKGRHAVAAVLAAIAMLAATAPPAAAAPAAAMPAAKPAANDVGIMSDQTFFCTDIAPNALCTTPNRRINMRTNPHPTSGSVVTTLDTEDWFWLLCYRWGPGSQVWYYGVQYLGYDVNQNQWPRGFVPGYALNTGPDPHPWVRYCL